MDKVNLTEKLATFSNHWSPRIIGQYNDNDLMVVKVQGEFVWHSHRDTDDLFLCLSGSVDIELRDKTVILNAGELCVVPAGFEHRPTARGEAHLVLIEPSGTPNTGDPDTAAHKPVI
ncbi:MAG: cupin domain-containing protein [Yoonia sp.]|nr:cupin domain-containing protein [Yoonia sp.]